MRAALILLAVPVLSGCLLPSLVAAQAPAGGQLVGTDDFADAPLAQWQQREQRVATENVRRLRGVGVMAMEQAQAPTADLAWPLQPIPGFDQFDYHGTKYFVDHDPRYPGFVQDYTCGTRTYDLVNGYNHAGTDYFLWPFAWLMMDQGQVQIVSAAPGVIADKADGNFDRDCDIGSSTAPNFVRVLQDDGLSAIYLHMRSGSVTTLPIGARVATGDYLGLVGSSGSSSGPHLHFELRDANGAVVDPRHGQCNAAPDRWIVFQPYEDPHIDTLSTHSAEPDQIACGVVGGKNVDDVPNYKSMFVPGDTLWVFASYRDQRNGEITNFSILRPDGSVFAQWDFDLASQNEPLPFYSGTAWDWQYQLPADAPAGTWQFKALFEGQTYARAFSVTALDLGTAGTARAQIGAAAAKCRPAAGNGAMPCPP
ncbi:MAG: peptidoglycan DD-metalloendopeptidase family protein [Rudaea sp.]